MHDIFAAQMWSWPDPLLKRDAHGQVLFVNEAFLRLYGGQVQDWHGNAVGGWPAPQGGTTPNRFETRMPNSAPTLDSQTATEQVYDWIESAMMDGTALCIGRDVTDLLTPAPNGGLSASAVDMTPTVEQSHFAPPLAPTTQDLGHGFGHPLQTPPQHAPAATLEVEAPLAPPSVDYAATSPTSHSTTGLETADHGTAVFEAAPVHQQTVEAPTLQAPETAAVAYEPLQTSPQTPQHPAEIVPQLEAEPQSQYIAPPAADTPLAPAPAATQDTAPATPAAPRRALPIQDSSSVLGNNWRDAVIAKAVGATAEEPAEATAPQAQTDGENTAYRILLAEDNAINALLTRTLLEAEGCIVEVVEDGSLAVEAMKTSSYDMIFMDMRMPNMDGLEATRKIRTLPNVPAELPIVALTANAFDDDRNACFDSGMNDFMTKPVSAEELADMVKRWAGKVNEMKQAS